VCIWIFILTTYVTHVAVKVAARLASKTTCQTSDYWAIKDFDSRHLLRNVAAHMHIFPLNINSMESWWTLVPRFKVPFLVVSRERCLLLNLSGPFRLQIWPNRLVPRNDCWPIANSHLCDVTADAVYIFPLNLSSSLFRSSFELYFPFVQDDELSDWSNKKLTKKYLLLIRIKIEE